MQNLSIFLGLIIGIALIVFAYSLYIKFSVKSQRKKAQEQSSLPTVKKVNPANTAGFSVSCPLCNSALAKGENLSSRVFRPVKDGVESDQRCTILGCPHCLPYCRDGVKRKCPVCGKSVPAEGYLVARLFTSPRGKRHVRITGCTECHKKM